MSNVTKYRKKPVVIEAMPLTNVNGEELATWCGGEYHKHLMDGEFIAHPDPFIRTPTLEGTMVASVGDYVIKGVNGEFYPCKPDIFHKTYEVAQ